MIERRDILFDLSEICAFLQNAPKKPQGLTGGTALMSALSGHDLAHLPHERKMKLLKMLDSADAIKFNADIIFEATTMKMFQPRHHAIAVPREMLKDLIIAHCKSKNIILPKAAEKQLIVEDLYIGIRLVLNESTLSLED